MSDAARKRTKLIFQMLVSACLIVFVIRQIDQEQIRSLMQDTRGLSWLLTALILFNLSKIAGALRLNIYQRQAGIQLGEWENLKLYYVGMLLNFFLPGGIGGDGYKILVLHRRHAAPVRLLLWTTLADRVSGLLILIFLACLLTPFLGLPWPAETVFLLSVIGAASVAALFLLLHRRFPGMNGKRIVSVCGYGAIVQLLQLACMAILLAYLQVPASHYPQYLWLFLVSSVAAALPLSFGGLGAREVTFLYGLQVLQHEPTHGVVAASMFFLITVLSSLPGALFLGKARLGRGESTSSVGNAWKS